MKSSKKRPYEIEDIYRPKGRNESILNNELNEDNSVMSIDPESTHRISSLEMELLVHDPNQKNDETEYSRAGRSETEYLKCRDALEETLTLLTGSDDDDKRKSCTKLIAAVFVLSHVVHEFSVVVTKQQVQKNTSPSTTTPVPGPSSTTDTATLCEDNVAEKQLTLITETQQVILSLEELVKELQRLKKDSEMFQKIISNAYRFCADVQRQGNSEWNGERVIIPASKHYFQAKIYNSHEQSSDDVPETQWLLLVKSKELCDTTPPQPSSSTSLSKSQFNLFTGKSTSNKMIVLTELIKKTRLLIAVAHSQLQIARKTFMMASATKLFQNSKYFSESILNRKRTTKQMSWVLTTVHKLFPTTRSLITLINSICEIIQPAEIISSLTFEFLSKISLIAFKDSKLLQHHRKGCGEIWNFCTTKRSKYFCLKLFHKISTSKTWFKIELLLNSFADSLCIEEITLLMEHDCLVLGRNCMLTSSGLVVNNPSKKSLSSKKSKAKKSDSKEQLDYKDELKPDPNNDDAANVVTNHTHAGDVPVDPYDSQFRRFGGRDSQDFSTNTDLFIPQNFTSPDPDVILAAATTLEFDVPPQPPDIIVYDFEGNLEDETTTDNNLNNYLGPILIEVDMEGCPGHELPSPPADSDNENEILSQMSRKKPTIYPTYIATRQDVEMSSPHLIFHTINFITLLYNLWHQTSPEILIKLKNKAKDKLKSNNYKIIGQDDIRESQMKVVEAVKSGKSVQFNTPPPGKGDAVPKDSSTLIRWKESARRTNYRRSSVPFADRSPKVRFNRIETCITSLKQGPHQPILGGTEEEEELRTNLKSILKITEHPILVDMTLFSVPTEHRKSKTLSTDELMVCVSLVERIINQLSKAERQVRGVFDILSFPSSTVERVELLGRFKATLLISISIMDRIWNDDRKPKDLQELQQLKQKLQEQQQQEEQEQQNSSNRKSKSQVIRLYNQVPHSKEMTHITSITESLLTKIKLCFSSSRKFLAENKTLSNEWEYVLKKKNEFYIPHDKKRKSAVYPQQIMPENVTLYENIVESPYHVEGNLNVLWNENFLKITSDLDPTPIEWDQTRLIDRFEILETVLYNGFELLKYAIVQLQIAVESMNDASLHAGYESVKSRLLDSEIDAFFYDPLVALELKNTLGELIARKAELLNLAEKLDDAVNWCFEFIDNLHTWSIQLLNGDEKDDKKYQGVICGLCAKNKFVGSDDLFYLMGHLTKCDLLISVPMSIGIQMTMQKLQNAAKMRRGSRKSVSVVKQPPPAMAALIGHFHI